MTESELRRENPWAQVARRYHSIEFLLSKEEEEYVCDVDSPFIKAHNQKASDKETFILNVPAYPWYGNPLTAKVIALSLNPGFDDKESIIARIIQNLPPELTYGYADHLRRMLTFDADGFLPSDEKHEGVSCRDIANIHQRWYWSDRLIRAFIDKNTQLTFDDVNRRFAVIEYIGYSSRQKPSKALNSYLPSQEFTRHLIRYILQNNKDTVFIVARSENEWKNFLGEMWDNDRFIISNAYRGQHISKKSLGERGYNKVLAAFK